MTRNYTNDLTHLNKYLPIVLLYFFFNSFLLPHGLLYTTILTPVFLLWLYRKPPFRYVWIFFAVLSPFAIIHLVNGVYIGTWLKSVTLLFTVYVFCLAFHQFLAACSSLRSLYRQVLLVNIILTGLAILSLAVPFLSKVLWYSNELTTIYHIRRLRLFTYEASFYSLLLAPLALYYYLKIVLLKLPHPAVTVLLISIPLALSLSFGVIIGLLLSVLITLCWGTRELMASKRFGYFFLAGGGLLLLAGLGLVIFPDNVVTERIAKILAGEDTSFQGRTVDSFYLGWKIAEMKSIWFGAGPGQTKELGLDLFRKYYSSRSFPLNNIRIPNAAGDTLATFGLVGLALRIIVELYFFFSTRVYNNYYRFSLFIFIFIYQFTGSYLTNIVEYTFWIMAFHQGLFEEFDRSAVAKVRKQFSK